MEKGLDSPALQDAGTTIQHTMTHTGTVQAVDTYVNKSLKIIWFGIENHILKNH